MKHEPVIEFQNVSFSYGNHWVLEDVSLHVHDSEFVSIVGPNGGGKTTLIKLTLGLLRPDKGSIRVLNQSPDKVRSRIGYVPQHCNCDLQFPVRISDVVLMGRLNPNHWCGYYSREDRVAMSQALNQVGLSGVENQSFSTLSGGQRQRVMIARALASEPSLLLLDEPTSNVDANAESELYTQLKAMSRRLTVVLVTHDLGFASKYVDTVVCVNRKVLVHPTSEINGQIISDIYGSDIRMIRHDHQHDPERRCS